MKRARIDYVCIASHAYAIANQPVFEGSELTSSSTANSTSSSDNERIDRGPHFCRPDCRFIYQRPGDPAHQGFGGYPAPGIPPASGDPLETWLDTQQEHGWIHDPYFHPPTGVLHNPSITWNTPLQYAWSPQAAQPLLPSRPPSNAPRQRQHARVINSSPRQAYQNYTVRVYQVSQAAVPSHGSDHAPSAASRSTNARAQGVTAPSQQQEPFLRHRRALVLPSRPSHAGSSSETPDRVEASRRGLSSSLDGGHDPAISQPISATATPQTHHPRTVPRPAHAPSSLTEDSPSPRKATRARSSTRSSARSRSSSRAGSSPSTTFSEARASGPSSPATSFSVPPSSRSARDSGYSSGGSVGDPEADGGQKQHQYGNSHYPPNSYETRRGGYDVMQEIRRSRRERGR